MKPCEGSGFQMWPLSNEQQSKRSLPLGLSALDTALAELLLLGVISLLGFRRRWEVAGLALPVGSSGGSKLQWGADVTKDTCPRMVGNSEVIEDWRSKLTPTQILFPDPALQ